jgi:SAM-dependent methyltransferase
MNLADLPRGNGVLDLLGDDDPTGAHPGQRLMVSRALPVIYERVWRPIGGRIFMGAMGPGMRGEHGIALEMLALEPGDKVLDVACGPGNFTRSFAHEVGDHGLVVGLDASRTMLERAVREGVPPNVAYVRADASRLPFDDDAFDAVCCFAALYLIADPLKALDEIARVLAQGGRVAILTSVSRGLLPAWMTDAVLRRLTGVRIFGRDEITEALRDRGLEVREQRVAGLAQFVAGRRAAS